MLRPVARPSSDTQPELPPRVRAPSIGEAHSENGYASGLTPVPPAACAGDAPRVAERQQPLLLPALVKDVGKADAHRSVTERLSENALSCCPLRESPRPRFQRASSNRTWPAWKLSESWSIAAWSILATVQHIQTACRVCTCTKLGRT